MIIIAINKIAIPKNAFSVLLYVFVFILFLTILSLICKLYFNMFPKKPTCDYTKIRNVSHNVSHGNSDCFFNTGFCQK